MPRKLNSEVCGHMAEWQGKKLGNNCPYRRGKKKGKGEGGKRRKGGKREKKMK